MQEPIVFVTVTVRSVDMHDRVEEYDVTINLNHVKFISGNHISITDNLGYDLTEESANSLREILDRYCWMHDCHTRRRRKVSEYDRAESANM